MPTLQTMCGALCGLGGAALVIGAFFGPLHWLWAVAGVALVLFGWYVVRRDRSRNDKFDALDGIDVIDSAIDLFD